MSAFTSRRLATDLRLPQQQTPRSQYGFRRTRTTPAALGVVGAVALGVALGVVGLVGGGTAGLPVVTMLLFALGYWWSCAIAEDQTEKAWLGKIFLLAVSVRMVYTVVSYWWLVAETGAPFLGPSTDDRQFDGWIRQYYLAWQQGELWIDFRHPGFLYLITAVRYAADWLGGYHELIPRLLVAVSGSLVPPFVYVAARNVFGHAVGRRAAILAVVFPALIFYSSFLLRDSIIVLLTIAGVAQISQFANNRNSAHLLYAFAAVLILLTFRTIYAVALMACLLAVIPLTAIQAESKTARWRLIRRGGIMVGLMVVLVGVGYAVFGDRSVILQQLDPAYIEEKTAEHRNRLLAVAESGSLGAIFVGSSIPEPIASVARTAVASIMPYPPWQKLAAEGPLVYATFANAFAWSLLVPSVYYGLLTAIRRRHWRAMVVIVVPWILALFVSSATGFILRYRLPAFPFALILAAYGYEWARRSNSTRAMWQFYIAVQLGLLVLYVSMKYVL